MEYYPVYLNLNGCMVLVVGGGRVAARKVESLRAAGAAVRVVSPELEPSLSASVEHSLIEHRARPFQEEDLADVSLVISATDDPVVNERVYRLAQARRIFCNVVDQPSLCSFIAPAVIRQGNIRIAISTGGRSPALAVRIKKEIAARIDSAYAELLEILASLRSQVADCFPGPEARAEIYHAIAESEALELLRLGKREAADHLIADIIAKRQAG
jgi:siroheme synthase-like protein